MIDLEHLKALEEKATAIEEWHKYNRDGPANSRRALELFAGLSSALAASRSAVPSLIKRVEELEAENAKLKRAVEHLRFATRPISE